MFFLYVFFFRVAGVTARVNPRGSEGETPLVMSTFDRDGQNGSSVTDINTMFANKPPGK